MVISKENIKYSLNNIKKDGDRRKVYFIVGAEGVGKSTVLKKIKERFLMMSVYDFDEVGVPQNPTLSWRLDTTKYWLKKFIKNQERGIDSCILGLCFPEEIKKMSEFGKLDNAFFCLLDVNKEERKRRLIKRNASEDVINDIDNLLEFRNQFKEMDGFVIKTSELSVDEMMGAVIKFMEVKK